VTRSEPELLALQLQQLIERRARMRAALESALRKKLTQQEVTELQATLEATKREQSVLEARLQDLQARRGRADEGQG